MQEATLSELFGIAKKYSKELEDLPLHQASAISEMVRVGVQVRAIAAERKEKEEQMDQQARNLRLREQQMEMLQREQERAVAAEMAATVKATQCGEAANQVLKPHLVAQNEVNAHVEEAVAESV